MYKIRFQKDVINFSLIQDQRLMVLQEQVSGLESAVLSKACPQDTRQDSQGDSETVIPDITPDITRIV